MSELALQIIAGNKKTKGKTLDLGNCGLTELPEEVLDCIWLEELILSGQWIEYYLTPINFEVGISRNGGKENRINYLPSSFSSLKLLKKVIIDHNNISDLSPISDLQNLCFLCCGSNQITDLSPIAKLTKLRTLQCGSNQISDLSSISQLIQVEHLNFYSNQISDLSPISRLTNLKDFSIGLNPIRDFSPLDQLPDLRILHCNGVKADFSIVSRFYGLNILSISSCDISDLSEIAKLANLGYLDCSWNQIVYRSNKETG
ncbi:MAG: leucine-rich repeat domain-containing protein [Saprospiraceae bacterium]